MRPKEKTEEPKHASGQGGILTISENVILFQSAWQTEVDDTIQSQCYDRSKRGRVIPRKTEEAVSVYSCSIDILET